MDIITKNKIVEMINNRYYSDIEIGLNGRSCWKITGDVSETLGYLCIGASTIVSFSAGFFNIRILSFIAGGIGVLSGLLLKFSLYSMAQSKERTEEINRILTKLNIDTVVDISCDQIPKNIQSNISTTPIISI